MNIEVSSKGWSVNQLAYIKSQQMRGHRPTRYSWILNILHSSADFIDYIHENHKDNQPFDMNTGLAHISVTELSDRLYQWPLHPIFLQYTNQVSCKHPCSRWLELHTSQN